VTERERESESRRVSAVFSWIQSVYVCVCVCERERE